MGTIGIILLAAGASTRLGTPKQLLRYEGQTLLRRAAETAVNSSCHPILVVLGAQAELLRPELEGLPVEIVENVDWEQGMGASTRAGMQALRAASEQEPEAALFMLCDQPFVTVDTLKHLLETYRASGRTLVASEYNGMLGVPALFHRTLFHELAQLTGTEGAKQIIQRHHVHAIGVPFPEGAVDVDTPEDYEKLQETLPPQ